MSDKDFDWCYQKDPLLKQSAPKQFVIGHGNESYRTNDHFLNSIEDIMTITALFSFSTGESLHVLLVTTRSMQEG